MNKNKEYTVEKVKKICERYEEVRRTAPYPAYNATDLIEICDKMKALGLEWGDKFNLPIDFRMTKKYYLTNSMTKYQPEEDTYYIEWDNGNVGRLQFVAMDYYRDVADEWKEFKEKLLSYDPLDWDDLNDHIIYDVENGKRLMKDYPDICRETKNKMMKKIKTKQIERMQKEIDKMREEVKE